MFARVLLRRLLPGLVLIAGGLLFAYLQLRSHLPANKGQPTPAADAIDAVTHAAHVALRILAAAGSVAAAALAASVAGHLAGRYLRRADPSALPGALGRFADRRRASAAPVVREIVLGRDDRAKPYAVAKLLEGLHGMRRRTRWYERALTGADPVYLGFVNDPATRTLRLTVAARADTIDSIANRLRHTYRDIRLRPIDLWPQGPPDRPLARLRGRRTQRCAWEVVRLKKTRRWLWALQTTRDYEHSVVEAVITTMAGSDEAVILQLCLTPTPRLLERIADRSLRRAEQRLNAHAQIVPTAPGVHSAAAQKHLQGAVESIGRSLYFFDLRIAVPRGQLTLARQLAGVIHEARAENDLAPRVMRVRRALYADRVARNIAPLLPGLLRQIASTAELATLWHLPTLRVKGVGLQRSGSRQISASSSISRDPRWALLVDEHGPIGLHPDDLRYGIAVLGAAGGGKSALCARHVGNVARDPTRALILIDPKEDLARSVLSAIPTSRTVHFLDLAHPYTAINPLTALRARGIRPEVIADIIVAAIRETAGDGAIGARSDQFLRAAVAAVCTVEQTPTLLHVYRMLDPDDPSYREWVVRELRWHPETDHLQDFWGRRFRARTQTNPRFLAEIMEAPLNKLARFLAVPSLVYLTSHPVQLDLASIIDRREILIVSGSKGAVGEDNAVLYCQLLVLLVQKLLHQQQRLDSDDRTRVALVIDEAHNLFTPSFATMLSEGRSGGLEALAAFQYTQQIVDERVRAGVKSLLQNICIFRLREFEDARAAATLAMDVYADNISPNQEDQDRLRIDPVDVTNLHNYRAHCLWLAGGVPQHVLTATTIPTEHIHQMPGAQHNATTHLARQQQRGHHPHDHGHAIVPPLVWRHDTPAVAHGRDIHIDLTHRNEHDPNGAEQVSIILTDPAGQATAYPAQPSEPSRRRWTATIPADPGHPGYLPAGRYQVDVIADNASWSPTVTVGEGEEARQAPVHVHVTDPIRLTDHRAA